jgi:hypothetical protein
VRASIADALVAYGDQLGQARRIDELYRAHIDHDVRIIESRRDGPREFYAGGEVPIGAVEGDDEW